MCAVYTKAYLGDTTNEVSKEISAFCQSVAGCQILANSLCVTSSNQCMPSCNIDCYPALRLLSVPIVLKPKPCNSLNLSVNTQQCPLGLCLKVL